MPKDFLLPVQKSAAICCGLIIVGFFLVDFLPILTKLGMIGLFLTALFSLITCNKLSIKEGISQSYGTLTGVFILHLISGLNTDVENLQVFLIDVIMQFPFLLMPLSFLLLPSWPARYIQNLYLLFFILVVISAFCSTGYYLVHKAEIDNLYSQSQIMPTSPDYIRFSLMITLSIVIGILCVRQKILTKRKSQWIVASTAFLTLFLYLLAVRSGLAAFNVIGISTIGWLVIKRKEYKNAIVLGAILIALPIVSFLFFSTFRNKYYNTQYDIAQVQTTSSANNLSLVGRYYSYQVGLQLVSKHPWFGVGRADMEQEVGRFYKRDYPAINPSSYLMPHNQFLYYWVAFGCIGLCAFVFCFYYPLFKMWARGSTLFVVHYIIISLSFVAEFTLDQKNQVGLIYSLLFILLILASMTPAEEGLESGILL